MLCIEVAAVGPAGRITPGCLGLWNEAGPFSRRMCELNSHRDLRVSADRREDRLARRLGVAGLSMDLNAARRRYRSRQGR
jgi:hypothetical protein